MFPNMERNVSQPSLRSIEAMNDGTSESKGTLNMKAPTTIAERPAVTTASLRSKYLRPRPWALAGYVSITR